MEINQKVLKTISSHNAKLVAVTKYFNVGECEFIRAHLASYPHLYGYGENRLEDLLAKPFDRSELHFLAPIQSQKIPQLVESVSVIHAVSSLKHLRKIMSYGKMSPQVFLQIQIDPTKPSGIVPAEFEAFWSESQQISGFEESLIAGVSGIGRGEFTLSEKIAEFKILRSIRDQFLPDKLISAGTSRDYEIALGEGVEVVRVGQNLFKN